MDPDAILMKRVAHGDLLAGDTTQEVFHVVSLDDPAYSERNPLPPSYLLEKSKPDSILETRKLHKAILNAIGRLAERQRIAFLVHRYEDKSYAEGWNLMGNIDDIEPSPYFWDTLHTKLISQRENPFAKLIKAARAGGLGVHGVGGRWKREKE